ncbi:hypothetical protein KSS87_022094 [Heliosperma pusillum]|nr:hypothetical protein KSS87_022094 [Heliosperma pusillum]
MKMAQNKIKIKQNDENAGVRMISKRRSTMEVNHWAFLEDMEAPMWADLTLPNTTAEDKDDAWFHTSHSFHHLSARQLQSAFAHPDATNNFVKLNLYGACSPKLPSSVSKSRGKDYINKPWRNNDTTSVSKNHPVNDLGGRRSRLDIAPSDDCKPPASPNNQSEVTDPVTSVQCSDSHSTSISCNSQVVADGRDTYSFLNSQSTSTSGLSTSTITTVSQRYDTKPSERFGMTGSLLNSLKTNLRRSCATRPALRVKMCDDRELKGRKSSSSKSSVGSSSIGYDGKVKRSTTPAKTDHLKQVKLDINVNIKPKGYKSLTGMHTSMSISNSMFEGKKIVVGNKQNKDKYLGVAGPEISVRPMKGRIIAKANSEAPVQKTTASLKLKEHRNCNVRDLGKLEAPLEGRAKFQKQAVKTRTCYKSRIEGGGAIAASTRLQAVKSKVPVSDKVKNYPRLGVPANTGKVGRVHLDGPSCSIKENVKRAPLSRISSGNCNIPVVRTIDQKRPMKLSETKGSVASVGS